MYEYKQADLEKIDAKLKSIEQQLGGIMTWDWDYDHKVYEAYINVGLALKSLDEYMSIDFNEIQ